MRNMCNRKAAIPVFELMVDPGHHVLRSGPYRVRASGPRIVENFLDVGHFPFVHEGVLGDRSRPEIAEYDAVVNDDGVLATGVKVYQPDPYATGEGATVTYTMEVDHNTSALAPTGTVDFYDGNVQVCAAAPLTTASGTKRWATHEQVCARARTIF